MESLVGVSFAENNPLNIVKKQKYQSVVKNANLCIYTKCIIFLNRINILFIVNNMLTMLMKF